MPRTLPWYDSYWLLRCLRAKEFLERHRPARVNELVVAFAPLRRVEQLVGGPL